MPQWIWLTFAAMVAIAVVVLLVALAVGRRKRTQRLKQRFGPEYERTVSAAGSQRPAERELAERERRRDGFDIVAVPPGAVQGFTERWHGVQTAFVDDPVGALAQADRLVTEVMRARGYPIDDFDQRADDLSVDHPAAVANYRSAQQVQRSPRSGGVGTEEQRQAFVDYRNLFEQLLEQNDDAPSQDTGRAQEATT